jgi:hypothetical protein
MLNANIDTNLKDKSLSFHNNSKRYNISLALRNYIDKVLKAQAENEEFAKWDLKVNNFNKILMLIYKFFIKK